jgi:hypothetical protein
MAKTTGPFYAATKIKFGKRDDSSDDNGLGRYEGKVFEVGQEVKGLDKEDMVGLWNAGALTTEKPETDGEDEEQEEEKPATETPTPTPTKTTPAKATAGTRGASQS